jgi:hypothetical protein
MKLSLISGKRQKRINLLSDLNGSYRTNTIQTG